jgi:hypothetical protein
MYFRRLDGVYLEQVNAKYAYISAVATGDYTPSASQPPLYERGILYKGRIRKNKNVKNSKKAHKYTIPL